MIIHPNIIKDFSSHIPFVHETHRTYISPLAFQYPVPVGKPLGPNVARLLPLTRLLLHFMFSDQR